MNKNPLYFYLALAGALPFIFGAVLLILGIESLAIIGSIEVMMSSYGLLIASFMAGSQWGQHLQRQDQWKTLLPIFTNVLVIVLWLCYLKLNYLGFTLVLVCAFLLLLLVDYKFCQDQGIPKRYLSARVYVTAVVVTSLLLSLPW